MSTSLAGVSCIEKNRDFVVGTSVHVGVCFLSFLILWCQKASYAVSLPTAGVFSFLYFRSFYVFDFV